MIAKRAILVNMAIIVDGRKLAADIFEKLRKQVSSFKQKPELIAVLVGRHPASVSYLNEKRKACEKIGIGFTLYQYDEDITTTQLRRKLAEVRRKKKHASCIIQLPLPAHVNAQYILNTVPPEHDPDTLSAKSVGLLVTGKSQIFPPTPAAILHILEAHAIDTGRMHCVLVGWGTLVGKPLSVLLAPRTTSLTIVHRPTPDISRFTREADLLISGVGKGGLISGDMVKKGVVAIDAGYGTLDSKLSGDFDYASVAAKASLITPVPGGVGPLTVAMLLKNVVTLACKQ